MWVMSFRHGWRIVGLIRAVADGTDGKGMSMGFRRRTRRRALVAGAAIAHHETKKAYEQAPAQDEAAPQVEAAPPPPAEYAPPPVDPADEIEHLAQLHDSGALTDDEFASAKAKALGS
jgi:hypothetical protein